MKRYFKIFLFTVKKNFLKDLSFKVHFLIRIFSDLVYLIIFVLFFSLLYEKIPVIAAWTKYEMILLLGTFHIIYSLFFSFCFPNLIMLPYHIRFGTLDGLLIKPINSQFLFSIYYFDLGSLINSFLGLLLVVYSFWKLNLSINIYRILSFSFFIIVGTFILYNIFFIIVTSAFWLIESSWYTDLFFSINNFTDKPKEIYKGIIYKILLYIVPLAVIANLPAKILLQKDSKELMIISIFSVIWLFALGKFLWKKGLKKYESASY